MSDDNAPSAKPCTTCGQILPRDSFSKKQWGNNTGKRRCRECIESSAPSTIDGSSGVQRDSCRQEKQRSQTPKFPDMSPRPQRKVPGFDSRDPPLTVCTDWPQTKNGAPPSAQSAIFGPLLCCALGPVDGHCSAEELDTAIDWWSNALPAWRRWIRELREAGILDRREALLRGAKGQPNPLIFRCRGWGTENLNPTTPHFVGREQNRALEMAPNVELEVMACTMVLYTAAQQENHEGRIEDQN